MLKGFALSNFKSIAEKQLFTMEAASLRKVGEFPDHMKEIGEQRLLKTSSLFERGGEGADLLEGLFVMSRVALGESVDIVSNEAGLGFESSGETEFLVSFIAKDFELVYDLKADISSVFGEARNTRAKARIHEETFSVRRLEDKEFETIFSRDERSIVSGDAVKSIFAGKKHALSNETSLLKRVLRAHFDEKDKPELKPVFLLAHEFSKIIFLNGNKAVDFIFKGHPGKTIEPVLADVRERLRSLGIDIVKPLFKAGPKKGTFQVTFKGKDEEKTFIAAPALESETVRTFLFILFKILLSPEGTIFLIQDLDAHLTPPMVEMLLDLVRGRNGENRQLIFSAHGANLMQSSLFRRDEIWISDKGQDGSSRFAPLDSFINYQGKPVARDAGYKRQFQEGRYILTGPSSSSVETAIDSPYSVSFARNDLPRHLLSIGRSLVYCEGTVTEPNYVENVCDHLTSFLVEGNSLDVVHGKRSKSTMGLYRYAVKDVAKRLAAGEKIDYVWIFFDKDEFRDFNDACRAIESLNSRDRRNYQGDPCDKNNVSWVACYSNACFELWVLLHYCLLTSRLVRKDYVKRINEQIRKRGHEESYAKNAPRIYDLIRETGGDVALAIKNALNLEAALADPEVKEEPSTGVYRFARYFQKYIEENDDMSRRPIGSAPF